ncbi:MAG TPA: hypothetical protein VGD04_07510 [Methylophilus sp.]
MNTQYLTLCLFSLLLHGCATQSTPNIETTDAHLGQKQSNAHHDYVSPLLQFSEVFTSLPTEAQKKLVHETNQVVLADSHAWMDKMKLATMLTLPNSDVRDPSKAQPILQALIQSNMLTATDVAYLKLLQEINTAHLKLLQKTKEEAKNAESLNQKYEALQKKYDALAQKLTDLKNIEKSLSEREVKAIEKSQP